MSPVDRRRVKAPVGVGSKLSGPARTFLSHPDASLVSFPDAGSPFKATRRINDEHQIVQLGEKLRAMMPWLPKGKMVDRARN
jgi:hypothetical protein